MAKREKISEERKKLIQEFIKSNDLKTAGDIQEAIKDLFKDTIQEMLNAELTEHLGYEKNEYTDDNENYRNGYSQKTVHSTEGDITLNVPRDRQGTFDPIVVEKGQKDISDGIFQDRRLCGCPYGRAAFHDGCAALSGTQGNTGGRGDAPCGGGNVPACQVGGDRRPSHAQGDYICVEKHDSRYTAQPGACGGCRDDIGAYTRKPLLSWLSHNGQSGCA